MKTTKNLSQHNRYSSRDLNPRPPEYEANAIHMIATISMKCMEYSAILNNYYCYIHRNNEVGRAKVLIHYQKILIYFVISLHVVKF
jgi:hypothetical protein